MAQPVSSSVAQDSSTPMAGRGERRDSGGRARARDRLMDRATQPHAPNPALRGITNIENLLLFVDDDLRETTLAAARIEAYLTRTLAALESHDLRRAQVHQLATDQDVLEQLDVFGETIESLRRRLAKLASAMKK